MSEQYPQDYYKYMERDEDLHDALSQPKRPERKAQRADKDYDADDDSDDSPGKGRADRARDRDPPRDKYADTEHLSKYSTKGTMADFRNSDVYPPVHAPFDDHGNAQIIRSNTRNDGDDAQYWIKNRKRREVSKANVENFNQIMPENNISARDFQYPSNHPYHTKAPDIDRDHSVTRESVRGTINKYPKEDKGKQRAT